MKGKLGTGWLGGITAAGLTVLAAWGWQAAQAGPAARLMTDAEMAMAVGDSVTAYPCFKTVACNSGIISGASGCAYCDISFTRDVCCTLSTEPSTCTYDGKLTPCGNDTIRYFGSIEGEAGTCGSCTSAGFQPSGFCNGLQDADGITCP